MYQSSAVVVFLGGTTSLSKSGTYGLEGFPNMRYDTFVDSELFTYTGQTTPLLQLSNHSSSVKSVSWFLLTIIQERTHLNLQRTSLIVLPLFILCSLELRPGRPQAFCICNHVVFDVLTLGF
ncbi:hypothetical protein TNCV_2506501 [Trichonephila clavipes]|uniref:Uncharacterized protein n=1 Tax=Trichonephila clavipes TaxID=2585209 RepID=A0A8X6WGZ1_TRICX|nr:hypothetical protein TNCV_2506501 [Trichonephila clavipes]